MTFYVPRNSQAFKKCVDYKVVGAGVTTSQLGAGTNAVGDYLDRLVIVAASTAAPGSVTLFDGTTTVMVFTFGGGNSMGSCAQTVDLGMAATSTKGWNITTGTSVSCIAIGDFDNDGQ